LSFPFLSEFPLPFPDDFRLSNVYLPGSVVALLSFLFTELSPAAVVMAMTMMWASRMSLSITLDFAVMHKTLEWEFGSEEEDQEDDIESDDPDSSAEELSFVDNSSSLSPGSLFEPGDVHKLSVSDRPWKSTEPSCSSDAGKD
jgi:hypothetical protein